MRTANSISFNAPQFAVLSESQMEDLHLAALETLRRTGIRFYHPEAIEMLRTAGAFVSDGNLVKITAAMVEDAIATVPGRIIMCDRDGAPTVFLEGTKVNFGTGSDCLNLLDPETGEHRPFTQQDLINGYHLCDALPNIGFVMSIGIPADVPPHATYDAQMALMLEHTSKPLVFVTNDKASCQRAIDMAAAVAGGYEALAEQQHILLYSEPSSPLKQSETAIDKLLMMADYRLPVVHSPGPQMGATAPITMAGGLVMSVAEIMSSIVVHQLRRPGAPFVFGAGLHHMDMGAMQICYASPEFQLTKAAVAQLGRKYGIPTWGYAGCSDAKVMDEQAALEATLSVMMAKLTGANLIHDVGYMESGLTGSYEMIVLTDELVAMTQSPDEGHRRQRRDAAGGGAGSGRPRRQLPGHRRDARPLPRLLVPQAARPQDPAATGWRPGGTTLGQRLNAKTRKIIKEHKPKPLAPEKKQKVQEILAGVWH